MPEKSLNREISRREMLRYMIGGGASLAGLSLLGSACNSPAAQPVPATSAPSDSSSDTGSQSAAGQLGFFTYAVYSDPQLVGTFTDQTGVKIVPENYGELDEMVTKLKARQGEGFDLVSVASNLTTQLYDDGVLQPIDTSRLSNWDSLYPRFRDASFIQTGEEGQVIGVPTVWGPEGLIYRTDLVEQPVDSWAAMWNPDFEGHLSTIDFWYEMVLMGAQYLGMNDVLKNDPIEFTDAQFAEIKAALIEQKALLSKLWHDASEAEAGLASGETWVTIGRILFQVDLSKEDIPVALVAPKEGAQGWATSTCVAAGAEDMDAVYEFLDYVISPDYGLPLADVMGYPSAAESVIQTLPDDVQAQMTMNNPDILDSMVWWQAAAEPQKWIELWDEVKAS